LVYGALVLTENAPKIDEGVFIDDDGISHDVPFEWTPKDVIYNIKGKEQEEIEFWEIRLSDALFTFVDEYEKGKITAPFTYQSYLNNDDIIDTLEAYGLDVEQFWYAILAVYWLTQIRCVNTIKPEGCTGEQLQKLSEYLEGIDSFTITAEGKKKLVINDGWVIKSIRGFLNDGYAENSDGFNNGYSVNWKSHGDHLESSSVQMWFSAERFLKLFENLELPTIRATGSEVKYKDKWGKQDSASGGNKTVSYNKLLLVSRLIYFMKLTRNENFLYTDESLKGIIKQYRNFSFNTYHPRYWGF
jgi:hypothetical protein